MSLNFSPTVGYNLNMQSKRHEVDVPENPDEEAQVRAVQQAFDLWITPEIERRSAAGAWPAGTQLSAAQILLPSPLENKPIIIRFNQEVRVLARIELAAPSVITPGDSIYERDIADVREILPNKPAARRERGDLANKLSPESRILSPESRASAPPRPRSPLAEARHWPASAAAEGGDRLQPLFVAD
jgi:hypothetical protein